MRGGQGVGLAGRQDPRGHPVTCSACVREAAALHRAEGSPEAQLTDVWGCPAPTQEEAVREGDVFRPAQVLTPAVPFLCAPQSQIPDLSLQHDGVGVAGRASSKQSATSSSKHPPPPPSLHLPSSPGWLAPGLLTSDLLQPPGQVHCPVEPTPPRGGTDAS